MDRPPDSRQRFEAFLDVINARDFEALRELLDPGVEFHSLFGASEGHAAYTGVEGMREWAAEVDSVWEDWHQAVVEFREVGESQAVVVIRATARARGSGVPLDSCSGNVLTWRNGKGSRCDAYSDPREAFEAVGLAE